MQLFSRVTPAQLKSCYEDELSKQLVFVVNEGEMAKAIGKGGANVHRLEQLLKTKIKLVEFSSDKAKFVQNLLFPLKVHKVQEEEGGFIVIEPIDHKSRGFIIGRAASALRNLEKNVARFYEIKEIKVM